MVRSKQPKRPDPHDPESAFGTKQEAVHLPTPTHRDLDPPGSDKLGLSPEEIIQFREKGYVIKRGLIPKATFSPFISSGGSSHRLNPLALCPMIPQPGSLQENNGQKRIDGL